MTEQIVRELVNGDWVTTYAQAGSSSGGAIPSVWFGMVTPDSSAGTDDFLPLALDIPSGGVGLAETTFGGPFTFPTGGEVTPFLEASTLPAGAAAELSLAYVHVGNGAGTQKLIGLYSPASPLALPANTQKHLANADVGEVEKIGTDLSFTTSNGFSVKSTAGGQFFVQFLIFVTYTP